MSKTLRKTATGMKIFLRRSQGGGFPRKNSSQKFNCGRRRKFFIPIAVFFSVFRRLTSKTLRKTAIGITKCLRRPQKELKSKKGHRPNCDNEKFFRSNFFGKPP